MFRVGAPGGQWGLCSMRKLGLSRMYMGAVSLVVGRGDEGKEGTNLNESLFSN